MKGKGAPLLLILGVVSLFSQALGIRMETVHHTDASLRQTLRECDLKAPATKASRWCRGKRGRPATTQTVGRGGGALHLTDVYHPTIDGEGLRVDHHKFHGTTEALFRRRRTATTAASLVLPALDASFLASTRGRVEASIHLNRVGYPWAENTYGDSFAAVGNVEGRPADLDGENELFAKEFNSVIDWLKASGDRQDKFKGERGEPDDHREDLGVQIWVYTSNQTTFITYRGTYSDSDFVMAGWSFSDISIEAWRRDFLEDWESFFGQDEELSSRGGGASKWFWNGAMAFGTNSLTNSWVPKFAEATGISEDIVAKQGYWPVYKEVTEAVIEAQPSGQVIIINGHSQGGQWAQAMGMYLKKKKGIAYPTIALDPVGVQCAALTFFPDEVDLGDTHDHILVYKDAFSHYAALDRQVGKVYYYGVDKGRQSYELCRKLVGVDGATIVIGPNKDTASQCRYYTHSPAAMTYHLLRSGSPFELDADGVPAGSRLVEMPVRRSDTCPGPYRDTSAYEGWVFVFFVLLPLTCVLIILFCICLPLRLCCLKKGCCVGDGTILPCCCCCGGRKWRRRSCCGAPLCRGCMGMRKGSNEGEGGALDELSVQVGPKPEQAGAEEAV